MLNFTIRRLLLSVPVLVIISFVIFMLLELAPGDPMANVPLTVPPEVKEKMREALGLGEPWHIRFVKWLIQFFVVEPQVLFDHVFGTGFAEDKLRVISWQTRSPSHGHCRSADPANPVGGRHVICHRSADRTADRGDLGL